VSAMGGCYDVRFAPRRMLRPSGLR
jgi:hypothetical protein